MKSTETTNGKATQQNDLPTAVDFHSTKKATSLTTTMILLLGIFTAIRVAFVLNLVPQGLYTYLNNPAWKAALLDPLYTVRHLREGQYLLNLSMINGNGGGGTFDSAYVGQVFHLPPLVLAIFQPILSIESTFVQNLMFGIVFMLVDLAIAFCLHDIGRRMLLVEDSNSKWEKELEGEMHSSIHPNRAWVFGIEFHGPSKSESDDIQEWQVVDKNGNVSSNSEESCTDAPKYPDPILSIQDLPQLCALLYYCNPISILTSIGNDSLSFQNICYLLILLALREPVCCDPKRIGGHASIAAFYLAIASYMEIFPSVFIIPIALLLGSRVNNGEEKNKAMLTCVSFFMLWSACLHFLSAALVGDDWPLVMLKTYGYSHGYVDLSPNLGLHWYLFIQVFGRFRLYFAIMMAGLPYIFISPICIRLHRYPFAMASVYALLWAVLKPVPTIYDACITLALISLSPRTVIRMGNASLVALCALVVPIALFIMDCWMWLETGVGNANYMYFQCLAFGVFFSTISVDFVSASLKRDKALRLTEKEIMR